MGNYGRECCFPDPSKVAVLRTQTPVMQVQTLPLEGPRILRVQTIREAQQLGLQPLVYVRGFASAGVDPKIMGILAVDYVSG